MITSVFRRNGVAEEVWIGHLQWPSIVSSRRVTGSGVRVSRGTIVVVGPILHLVL